MLPLVFLVELIFCWMVWLVVRLHFELSLLVSWPKTFIILFFNTIGNMYLGIPIATQICIICATAFLFQQQKCFVFCFVIIKLFILTQLVLTLTPYKTQQTYPLIVHRFHIHLLWIEFAIAFSSTRFTPHIHDLSTNNSFY